MTFHFSRWWIYSSLLMLSGAASVWVTVRGQQAGGDAAPVAALRSVGSAHESKASAPKGLALPVNRFPELSMTEQIRDPFAIPSRKQESAPPSQPPPVRIVEAAGKPTAPPLPFTYRGVLTDSDGAWLVQLGEGNDYLLAGPGDVIGSNYRLDALSEDELRFTYLPLATVQTLPLPPSQP